MKNKHIIITILLVFLLGTFTMAGADERCGITKFSHKLVHDHPELEQAVESARMQLEDETEQYNAMAPFRAVSRAQIIIPTVVHIIHGNGTENISDAKVIEGIQQVNEDFKMLNADSALIHPNFQGLVANTQMEFRLAKRDPNGNPTNGITRTYNPTWTENASLDESNMKLSVGWPQHKYLNVYVVKSAYGGSSSAYAHYPSSVQPPYEHYDGIIISAWAYGRTTPGYYTILSHEIGHWANLIHTWGDNVGAGLSTSCSIDDQVSDTPNTIGEWGTQCNMNTNSCGSLDNNENFMDYGQCATMFTAGQVARMHAAMNSSIGRRNEIWLQSNLIDTGVYDANQTPVPNANGPYSAGVGSAISFSSAGSYDPDGSISSYRWSFGDGASSNTANPSHAYTSAGTFTVTLTVTDNQGASASATTTATVTDNQQVVAMANGPYNGTEGAPVNFSSAGSSSPNGAIVQFNWDFGDGTTSTAANPTHTYAAAGTFSVRLTVVDELGNSATDTTTATITGGGGTDIIAETEPNDSSAEASGPMGFGTSVTGSFSSGSDQDWFYFDVTSPRSITITATMTGQGNWLLFHESDLSNYVAYPTSGLSGTYNASRTGRYFVLMYSWVSGTTPYTLIVQ